MSPIFKTPHGFYIDLDKIAIINPVSFDDRMGYGGLFVQYCIDIQFQDRPKVICRCVEIETECIYISKSSDLRAGHHVLMTDGRKIHHHDIMPSDHPNILAVKNLQDQADLILKAWEQYRNTPLQVQLT
jgi:hypothetical protein